MRWLCEFIPGLFIVGTYVFCHWQRGSVYATSSGKVANGTVVCCRCSESFKLSRLMPVDSSYAISYYWLIVAYVVLPTVSEVLRQKGWTSTFSACVNRPMLSMAKKVENLHFLPFYPPQSHLGLAVYLSGNALVSINVVTLRWARLVPGWVTVFGRVNCLDM